MKIDLNNEALQITENTHLSDFLNHQGYSKAFAVSLNGKFIPQSLHAEIMLKEKDRIDIIEPMQGG